MSDLSSPPPVRTKSEPKDSLSPKSSVESRKRSKTGCRTCRRRKKKCDEARPGCQNCAKNNVLCGGYEIKKPWRKGSRNKAPALAAPKLPNIIGALDDALDSHLLSYFISHSSQMLNIYSESQNPFDGLVVDMAVGHTGLMHSLLSLSASTLLSHQPEPAQEVLVRQIYHFDRAVVALRRDVEAYESNNCMDNADFITLQTILLCLDAIISDGLQGTYRCHLLATQRLFERHQSLSPEVREFARQFLFYHNLANTISNLIPVNNPWQTTHRDHGELEQPLEGITGILDGLSDPISRTRQIRDHIRSHRTNNTTRWYKNENIITSALQIEMQLQTWTTRSPIGTPQYWASLAYRQSAYIYLHRTIKPSKQSPELAQVVSEGLSYTSLALRESITKNHWVSGVLLPPLFLLGCGAFEATQRGAVEECLEDLLAFTRCANVGQVIAVLRTLWERMDAGDDAWDWEVVMRDLNVDILVS